MKMCQSLYLTILVIFIWQHQAASDTLVIEEVQCVRVATGIDNVARALAAAAGALIAGTVTSVTAGPAAPATAPVIATAAAKGASGAVSALEFLNTQTKGTDHLIIDINGEKVFPKNGKSYDMKPGDKIRPNIKFNLKGGARIQLIEYDWASDNDNLGSLDIHKDTNTGESYTIPQAIILNEKEGSAYFVTYRVERNNKGQTKKWILCGTDFCKKCSKSMCKNTDDDGLDWVKNRNKRHLKSCPPSFNDKGFKEFDNWWGDRYLRICSN